jgi:two-component system sensor histidine kinase AlgZ
MLGWSKSYLAVKHFEISEARRLDLIRAAELTREAELRALRYQLQPHFLFNALNGISTLVRAGDGEKATRMIARLAEILRSSLGESDSDQYALEAELQAARAYLDLERMRFGDRLHVRVRTERLALSWIVPRLILQPLVENAVKHGISGRATGGTIDIIAKMRENAVHLSVSNPLPDEPHCFAAHGEGVGLRNTRERLARLYGGAERLIVSHADSFQVTLVIPPMAVNSRRFD